MLEAPEFKDDALQLFKIRGVLDIDNVGMALHGKFMSKSGKPLMIRKEIYNRVRTTSRESDIEFACQVARVATFHVPESAKPSAEEQVSSTAATVDAAQKPLRVPNRDETEQPHQAARHVPAIYRKT